MRRFDLGVLAFAGIVGAFHFSSSYRVNALESRLEELSQQLETIGQRIPTLPTAQKQRRTYPHSAEVQLSSLEARLSALEDAQLQQLEDIAMLPTDAADPSTEAVPQTKADEALEPPMSEQIQYLRREYARGSADNARAEAVEAAFYENFSGNPLSGVVQIEQIGCRDSGCRVVWRYGSELSLDEGFFLENELFAAFGAAGLTSGTQVANESGGVETYFFPVESSGANSPTRQTQ